MTAAAPTDLVTCAPYYVDSSVTLWHGDALALPLEDATVDLGDKYSGGNGGASGLTSLGQRLGTGGGQKADRAKQRTAPVKGMRPKSLIGIPARYMIRCIDDLGLILRAEVIWSKPNGLPESVTDRVRRSHETWFHFTKEPRYSS